MLRAHIKYINFQFKTPGGTSRGVLHNKESWFLIVKDTNIDCTGIGECSIIKGLSPDDPVMLDAKLRALVALINDNIIPENDFFDNFPAVKFAYEMAMLDLEKGGQRILFDNDFVKGSGIPINGLIWMGSKSFMLAQIKDKVDNGFKCLKLKIGALNFEDELEIIKYIRQSFRKGDIELRVDANGAFYPSTALERLKHLSDYDLHSIEQPIAPNQWDFMAELVQSSPLPIALDEELINISPLLHEKMLQTVSPEYIILKPSLIGGFQQAENWIRLAEKHEIKWWITSALESNIGLNAIAQWTYGLNNTVYQGLGTGQLYTNNIVSPLDIINAHLVHTKYDWELDPILD